MILSRDSLPLLLPLLLLSVGSAAHAQDQAPPPPPPAEPVVDSPRSPPPPAPAPIKRLGVGYKAGNGIGFAGADLIITVMPNVVLDLQVAAVTGFDSGFALAPAVQGYLRAQGSSPYLGAGLQYVRVTLDDTTASGTGYFANIGYEWKWDGGLGIQLGGGVQYLGKITAQSATQMATLEGGFNPNLEIGLRYRFL